MVLVAAVGLLLLVFGPQQACRSRLAIVGLPLSARGFWASDRNRLAKVGLPRAQFKLEILQ